MCILSACPHMHTRSQLFSCMLASSIQDTCPSNVAAPTMAGSNKKAPYLKDSDHLERLVKEHIKHELDPAKHSGLWKSTDLDKVVRHYQDLARFLTRQSLSRC